MNEYEINGPVVFIGDIHGHVREASYSCEKFFNTDIKDIIFLGDIGFGFFNEGDLEELFDTVFPYYINLWIVRGNHDNPYYWYNKKNIIEEKYPRIHMLQDNDILTIHNHKYLIVGGGISIDKAYRKEGESYWPDEIVKTPVIPEGGVYGIISHSGPTPPNIIFRPHPLIVSASEEMKKDIASEQELFQKLAKDANPKQWFYAHYHTHCTFSDEGCVYHNLNILETMVLDNQDHADHI